MERRLRRGGVLWALLVCIHCSSWTLAGIALLSTSVEGALYFQEFEEGVNGTLAVLENQSVFQGTPQSTFQENFVLNGWAIDYHVTSLSFLNQPPDERRRLGATLGDAAEPAADVEILSSGGGGTARRWLESSPCLRRLQTETTVVTETQAETTITSALPTTTTGSSGETTPATPPGDQPGEGEVTMVMSDLNISLPFPVTIDIALQFQFNETFVNESRARGEYVTRIESTTTFTGNDTQWLTVIAATEALLNQTTYFNGSSFPTAFVLTEWPPNGTKWITNVAFDNADALWAVTMSEYNETADQPNGQSVLFFNGPWNNTADENRIKEQQGQGFIIDQVVFTERFFPVVFMSLYSEDADLLREQEYELFEGRIDVEKLKERSNDDWILTDITQSEKDGTLIIWSRNDTGTTEPTTEPPTGTATTGTETEGATTAPTGPVTRAPPRPNAVSGAASLPSFDFLMVFLCWGLCSLMLLSPFDRQDRP